MFSEASTKVGIDFSHNTEGQFEFDTGAAWFDADADGDLDLYISQRIGANVLYRNNLIGTGSMTFTDIATDDALDFEHIGAAVSVADYDNDGDFDIYLANADQDVLLQNDGAANFTNVTDIAFPDFSNFLPGRGCMATWGDMDGDGWLDLYITNNTDRRGGLTLDYFFKNNGGHPVTFSNMSSSFVQDIDADGIYDNDGHGFASVMTDFDGDGDLDLYVGNDCPGREDNKLWKNNGNLIFEEVSSEVGPFIGGAYADGSTVLVRDCQNTMGISVGDPNRDGNYDIFYTNWNSDDEATVLLLNDGTNLINSTEAAGLADFKVPETGVNRITWGTVFIDFNLDMLQDIAIAAGILTTASNETWRNFQPNLLYQNMNIENGIPKFIKIDDTASGFANPDKGRTLIKGDYDMDGDPDLFLVNFDGEAMLYENNNENDNNWIIIDLVGDGAPLSNLNGIGAKIQITTQEGISQSHEVRSGSSLGGGDDIGAYFGLAKNETFDVMIEWPSGRVTEEEIVLSNQRLKLYEVAPIIVNIESKLADENLKLEIFPNPIESVAIINFSVIESSRIKIVLLDISGKMIAELFNSQSVANKTNEVQFDFSHLKTGIYFLKMGSHSGTISKKLYKKSSNGLLSY